MSDEAAGPPRWIGALGPDDRTTGELAAALAELMGDAGSYYVPVTTLDVDRKSAQGARSCKLDAGLLTVTGSDGLTPEHDRLLHVLGEYNVPVIVVVTTTDSLSSSELDHLRSEIQGRSKHGLGYAALVFEVPSFDQALSAERLKALAGEAQNLALKRHRRRGKPGQTPKEYPFVIGQADLDRLMRVNVIVALEEHRERGESVVVWRDGRVVKLTGEEIDVGSAASPPRP